MSTCAHIATICQDGQTKPTVAANREHVLGLVDLALRDGPDLIVLPETCTSAGSGLPTDETVETVPGPTTEAVARRARAGRCYIVCPIHTQRGGSIYNSAIILDRGGQVAGVYDKACPVTTSPDYTKIEECITPGGPIPTFDLDFGRIGIQICFDIGFPENWQTLAGQGARLVLWPSAYDGGFPLRAYAYLHHFWVVSATRSGHSRIIDPCGEILEETSSDAPIAHRIVNLDYLVCHTDFNMAVPDRIRAAYPGRVEVREWDPGSGHFVVEPLDDSVTMRHLQEEFGLESTAQYHQRHRDAYGRKRAGEPLLPQTALHGDRPQWWK